MLHSSRRGRRGRDHKVADFTTTHATSAYHHWNWEIESRSWRDVLNATLCDTHFVSDLRQVGGFLRVLQFPSPNKTDRYDITDILLKVALNTIALTLSLIQNLAQWPCITKMFQNNIARTYWNLFESNYRNKLCCKMRYFNASIKLRGNWIRREFLRKDIYILITSLM